MNFEKLNISSEIVRALADDDITEPTAIQEKAIPLIRGGKDVIGKSETGSGKTVAFGVPILDMMEHGKGIYALILAPTRELVVQISRELGKFAKYIKCNIVTVYGGVAIDPQVKKITTADIVVGTPGRLLDHLERGTLDLSRIKCFVLDEADKMVEMGFVEDIERILHYTPKKKQMLLFGATVSDDIDRIKDQYMHDPVTAKAQSFVPEDYLKQYYCDVKPNEKFSLMVHLLKKEHIHRAMIFCSTRLTVEILTKNLRSQGIKAEMIHGKLSQNRRQRIMDNFNQGRPNVLVASAVAARGLDIRDVSHIFNYDLSQDPQEYIHRIGRTARAGETGKAITLLSPRDHDAFTNILSSHDIKVRKLAMEHFPRIRFNAKGPIDRHNDRRYGMGDRRRRERHFGSSRSEHHEGKNTDNASVSSFGRVRW